MKATDGGRLRGAPGQFAAWLLIVVALVSLLLVLFVDEEVYGVDGPDEGYLWSTFQLQVAQGKVREELRAIDAGGDADPQKLRDATDALFSRTHILRGPSELNKTLRTIPSFHLAEAALERFDERAMPLLMQPNLSREDANRALALLSALDQDLVGLVPDIRARELEQRASQRMLPRRLRWLGAAGLVLVIVGLAAWLRATARSRRIQERIARELQKALDAETVAVAGMATAVAAKNRFVGMVSHELRSPLQTILSSVDLLECDVGSKDRTEAIQRIRRASQALGLQLRDLLTLARGEAGKLEIRPESFEVTELVRDVAEPARHQAFEKGLDFLLTLPKDPVFAVADAMRIHQVLTNLVSNAVKYTEAGSVAIQMSDAQVGAPLLSFSVSDTGPGIPAHRLPVAFTAFERLDGLDGQTEGTGMGLAIVEMVVKHLGGRVEVDSRVGEGTTFRVVVPSVIQDADLVIGAADLPGQVKVLIVDDRQDVLDALSCLCVSMGHHCDVANSAAAGANHLAARKYDILLLDLDMPGKGGEALAAETAQAGGLNRHTPMVAMTAGDVSGRATPWPFDRLQEKPIERSRLEALIGRRRREI